MFTTNRFPSFLFFFLSLSLFISACGSASKLTKIRPKPKVLVERAVDKVTAQMPTSNLLGPRTAADPATAVEAYLQIYQPGPLPRVYQTTYLYDRNGTLIAEIYPEGQRTWVSLGRVSQHLIDATVATEDATFFENAGVEPRRLVGAIIQNAQAESVVSGGSTITMQLARNLFLGVEERYNQSINRKLTEINLSQELTTLYSKDEILEMYLNLLNYGSVSYGPEAAARTYFAKSAADLTLAEATMLAGIPQQPATLNPYTNLDAVKVRQRTVLDLMVRHGFLSEAEADQAYTVPLLLRNVTAGLPINRAPHFTQYVLNTLSDRLGEDYVKRGGLRIVTTLDLEMQALAERTVAEKVAQIGPPNNISNAALVALKPGTAEVLAMVGSADFFNNAIAGQVNVAVRQRQPGSTVKPLLYAAALDANLISPATVLWDTPMRYTQLNGRQYRPRNYDRKFHGPVTVRTALANSYNVPAVKLLDAFGVDNMLAAMRSMGLTSLSDDPGVYGLSLTLGGGEITLVDLVTGFHTLANGGRYLPPQPVLTTVDTAGHADTPAASAQGIATVSPAAAFVITDILSDNQARAPMFGTNSLLKLSRPAAAKTGTTSDWRDNWTVGYTRYLVTGVWAGNSDGRPTRGSTGARGAAPIWHAFMEAVLADPAMLAVLDAPSAPNAWQFTPPNGVAVRADCPPGVVCRADGDYFTNDWLTTAAEGGPLSDSVTRVVAAPVYLELDGWNRRVGYCAVREAPREAARISLLNLPAELGIAAAGVADNEITRSPAEEYTFQERAKRINTDRALALSWSLYAVQPVLLGACDGVDRLLRNHLSQDARSRARIGIDFAAVARAPVAAAPAPTADEVASAQDEKAADAGASQNNRPAGESVNVSNPVAPPPASVQFVTQDVQHGGNCSGNYILGRVVNRDGGPVAGVRVMVVDEWGNRIEVVSKAGATDAGQFDFPLYNDRPRDFFLSLLDGAGNPISPTVPVPHHKGVAVNTGCHFVVFQGV